MKMRILAGITALVVVGAGVFGVINRQTYTDITNEKNFMEKLQVAELPGQFAVTAAYRLLSARKCRRDYHSFQLY